MGVHDRSALSLALVISMVLPTILLMPQDLVQGISVPGGSLTGMNDWDLSDSPVIIEGNVTIPTGSSLTIGAGVTVRVKEGCWLDNQGSFIVRGTPANQVRFEAMGPTGFDRLNITSGGYAVLDNVNISGSRRGVNEAGASTILYLHNSTIEASNTGAYGLYASSSAYGWAVNCTFISSGGNVSCSSGAEVHEGNWFTFRAMKDNGAGPYQGANLEIQATKMLDNWIVYRSKDGDPTTGPDGRIPPIAVEQYKHAGSTSADRVVLTIKFDAASLRWTDQIYPVYMGSDIDYTWWMDFTPPPPPTDLAVVSRGGSFIEVSWQMESIPDLMYFNLSYKRSWESDKEYTSLNPAGHARSYNITALVEEMDYDIKLQAMDSNDNPSTVLGPISVKTLDITDPTSPKDLRLEGLGGTWAHIYWNASDSPDITGYRVFLNGTDGTAAPFLDTGDKFTLNANLTGIASETNFKVWVAAMDDAETPNLSPLLGALYFKTLDITKPKAPHLELWLNDPVQFLPGTPYYNSTQVGLKGYLEGENRTFIDPFVDGVLWVFPGGFRPNSDKGNFSFFITLTEGHHEISVRSVDPAGNIGPLSEPVSLTIDVTLPSFELSIDPEPFLEVDENTSFPITCTADDESGIHLIKWKVVGQAYSFEDSGGEVELSLPLGEYITYVMVQDKAGNWNITTFALRSIVPDRTAPRVSGYTPENGSEVGLVPEITVEFSEPLKWDALEPQLYPDLLGPGSSVSLHSEIDQENNSVTFSPLAPLNDGTNYTFKLEGIIDLRGNPGKAHLIMFSTIPKSKMDTDGDGIPDYYEVSSGFLNPSDSSDALEDRDRDGLTNLDEYIHRTDPESSDTDEDGMPDDWEVDHGLDPLSKADALSDLDDDGYTNLREYTEGSDPTDPSSVPKKVSDGGLGLMLLIIIAIVLLLILAGAVAIVIYRRNKAASGADRSELDEGAPPARETPFAPSGRECPSCGTGLDAEAEFCPECGATLEPVQKELEDLSGIDSSVMSGEIPPEEGLPELDDIDEE